MKRIRIIYLVSFFLLISELLSAADHKWEITGTIIEEQSGVSIPYVTIALHQKADSSLVTGCISNEEGVFVYITSQRLS